MTEALSFWPRLLVPSIPPPSFATPVFSREGSNASWIQTSLDGERIYEFVEVELSDHDAPRYPLGSREAPARVGSPLVYGYVFSARSWRMGTAAQIKSALKERYLWLGRHPEAQALVAGFVGQASLPEPAMREHEAQPYRGMPRQVSESDKHEADRIRSLLTRPTPRGESLTTWVRTEIRRAVLRLYDQTSPAESHSSARERRREFETHALDRISDHVTEAVIAAVLDCLFDPRPQVYHNPPHALARQATRIPDWLHNLFIKAAQETYGSGPDYASGRSYDFEGTSPSVRPPPKRLHRQKAVGMTNAAQHVVRSVNLNSIL